MKVKIYLKNNLIFILGFVLLLLPFYVFFVKNFYEVIYQYKLTLISIFLIALLSSYIFSKAISYAFKINFQLIFFFLNLSFYIQHNFFSFIVSNLEKFNLNSYSVTVAAIMLAILIILYFFQLKNKKNFFEFFFIFTILHLIYNSALIFKNIYEGNFFSQSKNFENLLDKTENIKLLNNNIYLVILDGMVSLEKSEKYLNINNTKFLTELNVNNLNYIADSKSVSNTTRHTLASLFNLDPVTLGYKKFKNRPKLLFPDTIGDSNLLKLLKRKHNTFYWIGNTWMDCYNVDLDYCINNTYNFSYLFNYLDNSPYFLKIFIKNTLLNRIVLKITSNKNFYDKQKNITLKFEKNISYKHTLKNFQNFFKKTKIPRNNTFFFIHHFSPHPPFIFDKRCNFKKTNSTEATLNNFTLEDYKYNYVCTQNDLLNFLNFIKIKDPNAHLIVMGDHGWNLERESDNLKKQFSRFDIFTAISAHSLCDNNKTYSTNLNHFKTLLNCVLNTNLSVEDDNRYYEYNDRINLYR